RRDEVEVRGCHLARLQALRLPDPHSFPFQFVPVPCPLSPSCSCLPFLFLFLFPLPVPVPVSIPHSLLCFLCASVLSVSYRRLAPPPNNRIPAFARERQVVGSRRRHGRTPAIHA